MDIDKGYVQVNFLGHYYFHAFDLKKKSETNKIERNRRLAYFNSSKHFFRSLHEKKLDENGYLVQESSTEDAPNSIENENTILINHANYIGNDILQLTGLKGKSFTISYYQDYRNEPLDSRKRHRPVFENPYKIEKSKMSFLKDTCVINKTGNVLNNEIMFGGSISQKRVGSYLPENYVLEK
jgi:hypothetical protein